ncbi:MAG: SfnB family sulfur acquisition oxidoreductase [Azospirillaceae bacterium]|nr:SfnB family sulfur acquisition oxidoreductase [Azospirillaceae bacterium]
MSKIIFHAGSGVVPELPARSAPARVITSDAEAIAVAHEVAAQIAPGASDRDRDAVLALDEIALFSQSGLWAITVPKDYGGAGVSAVTLAEVTAIIAAADASIGQIPQNHWYIVEALRLAGTPAQKAFFFGRVLEGDRIGNAFTEIGTRTPVDFKTTITRQADGTRVIEGQKFYSTGALYAHWIAVVANDEDRRSTITFIPRGTKGLELVNDWSSFGQRSTGSGTTRFHAVTVPEFNVIPHQVVFDQPTPMGPIAQIIQAAIDTGIARAALADTIEYTRKYARPWLETNFEHGYEDPYVIAAVGDLALRVTATNAVLERAGRFVDIAIADPTDQTVAEASIAVAEAKVLSTEASLLVASKLFELTGSRSTLKEFNFDRHWRNARTHTLHDTVRYKYVNVGNFFLNNIRPPRHGAL